MSEPNTPQPLRLIECMRCTYVGPGYKLGVVRDGEAGWESYCLKHLREEIKCRLLPNDASRLLDAIDRSWRREND